MQLLEEFLIYIPEKTLKGTPSHFGLEYSDLHLKSDGTDIHAWWIPGPNGCKPLTWIIFHGNGGNMSVRLDSFKALRERLGTSILALDYRGYGLSNGQPTEMGIHKDAISAARWAQEHSEGHIVYHGVSLGGAVAARLAEEMPPDALVVESAFTSLHNIMCRRVGFLDIIPKQARIRKMYNTAESLSRQKSPVLIMHGDRDSYVPFEMARSLFKAANEPKELVMLPDADHNRPDLTTGDLYYSTIARFLIRHTSWTPQEPMIST